MGEVATERIKILVTTPEGHRYVYELGTQRALIGRGGDCALGLAAPEVSRHHAALEAKDGLLFLTDLDSTNGTFLNDVRVDAGREFRPGDLVHIGGFALRRVQPDDPGMQHAGSMPESGRVDARAATVVAPASPPAHDTVVRDETQVTDDAEVEQPLPVIIHERGRHMTVRQHDQVISQPLRARNYTIGRGGDNDFVVNDPRASQQHARLLWQEGDHYVEDLGSTNGTRLNGVLVGPPAHLRDGDLIRIGDAELHFTADDLPQGQTNPGRRPVVLIPGLGGSELWLGDTCIWPNLRRLLKTPEPQLLEEWRQPMRVGQMVREPASVPGLARSDSFSRVVKFLVEELGYQADDDFIEHPYDWRADNAVSARHLIDTISSWRAGRADPTQKITIIAHSMGGLVARAALCDPLVADACERCIFLGTPHHGSVSALACVIPGQTPIRLRMAFGKVTNLALQLDAFYQLLPTFTCAAFEDGRPFSHLAERGWLPAAHHDKLDEATLFHQRLNQSDGRQRTTCIFGYGQKTLESLVLSYDGDQIVRAQDVQNECGDGIVTERSAVLSSAEIHPIDQHHGALFSDPDVLRRIRYELLER